MIEEKIKVFLDQHLAVPSFLAHEREMPERYVLFEKTSGRRKNYLSSATFAFQSYAESLYEAARLNEAVKKAVYALGELSFISGVYLNSDYNFTDTALKKYRYQAVFDLYYVEEENV